jgi:hypothetical protein
MGGLVSFHFHAGVCIRAGRSEANVVQSFESEATRYSSNWPLICQGQSAVISRHDQYRLGSAIVNMTQH